MTDEDWDPNLGMEEGRREGSEPERGKEMGEGRKKNDATQGEMNNEKDFFFSYPAHRVACFLV